MKKSLLLFLMLALAFTAACSSNSNNTPPAASPGNNTGTNSDGEQEQPRELLNLKVYHSEWRDERLANNNGDIVTPVIEEKFNVKFEELYILNSEQPFRERLNQFIAVNEVPDLIITNLANGNYAIETGRFAELSDYLPKLENHAKYFNDIFWPRFQTEGESYVIPLGQMLDEADPYVMPRNAQAIWVREDIAEQAGYSFAKSQEELEQMINNGQLPTPEDYGMVPAVDTPEKFAELLQKVKDLNLQVGNREVIPFTIPSWTQFHMGSMFDFGHWRKIDGEVAGWLGSPGAKDYYAYLNDLYRRGLIDKDFIIHRDEQLQEKAASGRVFAGIFLPDLNGAISTMQQLNPEAKVRFIPWPKQEPDRGFFDIEEGAYFRLLVRKDFPDMDRLIEMIDWGYSDEGLDLYTWGPADSGLWTEVDGKRRFVNEAWNEYYEEGRPAGMLADGDSPNFAGLNGQSKAGISMGIHSLAGEAHPFSIVRAFPLKHNLLTLNQRIAGGSGIDVNGVASYGSGPASDETSGYFWSKFQSLQVSKLLTATNEQQFDNAWDEIYTEFLREGRYEEAVEDMKVWFNENQ